VLYRRLIPSLLLRRGRLVKGVRYAEHRDAGNPATVTRAHNAQDADELIVLDIDAAREGRGPDMAAIARVADECAMPLTVGGGIRDVADARACMAVGADKLMVTSAALDRPALIGELARVFGSQAVVVGIDVLGGAGEWRLYDHRSGAPAPGDVAAWIVRVADEGAGEIRLMAVEREGTRTGFDLDLLALAQKVVRLPVVIEGGAGSLEHCDAALAAGADAIALGTMLVFSDYNLVKVARYLASRGHRMRA
jgi:imidazole glycerol-phosphate synthase subunit HisF